MAKDVQSTKEGVTSLIRSGRSRIAVCMCVLIMRASDQFRKLGDVTGAEYSNDKERSECTPGTRIMLLASLLAWAGDRSSPHVYWLSGPAGIGKTAVGKTFCRQLKNRGTL